jgi:hypothetical protein
MSAGADCSYTISGDEEELTLEQFIEFLEGPEGEAGALCMPNKGWTSLKTALDQACKKLTCTYEVKREIRSLGRQIENLQNRLASRRQVP